MCDRSHKRLRSVLQAGLAISVVMLPGCQPYPPARPYQVPSSAQWAGGIDGGAWVDCSTGSGPYNECQVYGEKGDLMLSSAYALEGLNRAATRSELRYRYVDGTTILLQGGLSLIRVSSLETPATPSLR